MSIENYYATKVSVKGLTDVAGTDKEIFAEKIPTLYCRIEAQGEEPVELGDGAFYNLFKMWCKKVNIKVGDKVIDEDEVTYIVKGISDFKRATETVHHMEILLAVPR